LRLQFYTNNLDRLVPEGQVVSECILCVDGLHGLPARQTTADGRGGNFVKRRQRPVIWIIRIISTKLDDGVFSNSGQTKAATPVGALPNGHCVDTFVDSTNALSFEDVSSDLESGGIASGTLVTCHLDGFHELDGQN
jgi:hypothetical protein